MFTILIEIVMSVFIANFKVEDRPILSALIRGLFVAIVLFFLIIISDIRQGGKSSIYLALLVSLVVGVVLSAIVFLIEFIFDFFDKK